MGEPRAEGDLTAGNSCGAGGPVLEVYPGTGRFGIKAPPTPRRRGPPLRTTPPTTGESSGARDRKPREVISARRSSFLLATGSTFPSAILTR